MMNRELTSMGVDHISQKPQCLITLLNFNAFKINNYNIIRQTFQTFSSSLFLVRPSEFVTCWSFKHFVTQVRKLWTPCVYSYVLFFLNSSTFQMFAESDKSHVSWLNIMLSNLCSGKTRTHLSPWGSDLCVVYV